MPATEQTWRNQLRLHFIFGATGLVLLLSTLWMFAADHDRSWKTYQKTTRNVDLKINELREYQFETDEYQRELRRLEGVLAEARGRGFDQDEKKLISKFEDDVMNALGIGREAFNSLDERVRKVDEVAVRADAARQALGEAELNVDRLKTSLEEARAQQKKAQQQLEKSQAAVAAAPAEQKEAAEPAVRQARTAVEETTQSVQDFERQLEQARSALVTARADKRAAEEELAPLRQKVLESLDGFIADARFEEQKLLQNRKFAGAIFDRERAKLDLAIRDEKPTTEQQEEVSRRAEELQDLTVRYQRRADYRKQLEKTRNDLTKAETEAEKNYKDHLADQQRLLKARKERRSNFFTGSYLPLPGKKWLELPILDAFNSPLKIENLWSDELEWNINFRTTRRYDRCTTCHQNVLKTLPGAANDPAFPHEQLFVFTLLPREAEGEQTSATGSGASETLAEPVSIEKHFGLHLAAEGLINVHDVTVSFVEPYSIAAAAAPVNEEQMTLLPAEQLRLIALQPVPIGKAENVRPGLLVGDVIESISGDRIRSGEQANFLLLEAANSNSPVQLTIRRGLPHPYTTHPRLDLYLGSMSPHKIADFACTICHDGQGSATEFKWASHTPNSPLQRDEWSDEHGWFDNHHWIYPMYAKRFLESTCLKCHHEVTELEASDRFPDPPAPKLMHGYQLITKYGCYGCHEINGYDGARRIGPDMRLEPNFFAAAQRLQADEAYQALSDDEKDWVEQLIEHPERDDVRRELYDALISDKQSKDPRLSATVHNTIAPMFKDIEAPGKLRKVGPSLRYVKQKLDPAFLYDWIRQPSHFRPTTRMPQFFGLHDHLDSKSRAVSEQYEPIEILGAVHYLLNRSQKFTYLPREEGTADSAADEKIERGKVAFEQQGCLACHSHRDFPDVTKYRPPEKIQQAPDLSNVGDKFDPARNAQGRDWLYSWIKQPNRYHVRTLMPNVFLEPVVERDMEGKVLSVSDPVDDIVEYLMSSRSDWKPAPGTLTALDEPSRVALDNLTGEYLRETFSIDYTTNYLKNGIPEERRAELKGAETELVVSEEEFKANSADNEKHLSDEQKLIYIGRRTIAKYGCYGCHDIPGFEDAKPIGTGLADWGRKDPARLAFEHIDEYLKHGHGHAHGNGAAEGSEGSASPNDEVVGSYPQHRVTVTAQGVFIEGEAADTTLQQRAPRANDDYPPFFEEQMNAGNRIGFIYQKLRAPRSYDFLKTENKKYNERLRMPQFPFSVEEREAVITFVLGLVGEPPKLKYMFKPNARTKSLLEGRQVLEKYNCGGCHVLEGERWEISYRPGQYGEQQRETTYPFVLHQPALSDTQKSAATDYRNLRHAVVEGLPALGNDGMPLVNDPEGDPIVDEGDYSVKNVEYSFHLFKPTVLDGFDYQVNVKGLGIRGGQVERRHAAHGGDLAKYLLPRVVAQQQALIPTLKGAEAWGWLPPPLINEGLKVQTDWLHSFLLDPYAIRPATVLRMPKFNMSPQEATILVNYFAARDSAAYPYSYSSRKRIEHLEEAEAAHRAKLENDNIDLEGTRLDHGLNIVTNSNYCVQCHIVGDFNPTKEERGKGPNLAQVYKRLRPEYLRNWIAQPTVYLPYTGMPVNIKYDPSQPHTGTLVPQELFPGDSVEQLDGLVDLLMNYDLYSAAQNRITPLVQEQQRRAQEQGATEGAAPRENNPQNGTEPPPGTDTNQNSTGPNSNSATANGRSATDN